MQKIIRGRVHFKRSYSASDFRTDEREWISPIHLVMYRCKGLLRGYFCKKQPWAIESMDGYVRAAWRNLHGSSTAKILPNLRSDL